MTKQRFIASIFRAISGGETGDVCMNATLLLAAERIYRQGAGSGDRRTTIEYPTNTSLLKAAWSQPIYVSLYMICKINPIQHSNAYKRAAINSAMLLDPHPQGYRYPPPRYKPPDAPLSHKRRIPDSSTPMCLLFHISRLFLSIPLTIKTQPLQLPNQFLNLNNLLELLRQ